MQDKRIAIYRSRENRRSAFGIKRAIFQIIFHAQNIDVINFAIRMKNGVQAVFYATVGYGIDAPVEVEAVLEKGRLLMRGESLFSVDDGYMRLCAPDGQPVGARDYWGSGHRAQVGDFYRCVAENRPFAIDGVQGIEAVKLVCGLYESSRTGQTVTL